MIHDPTGDASRPLGDSRRDGGEPPDGQSPERHDLPPADGPAAAGQDAVAVDSAGDSHEGIAEPDGSEAPPERAGSATPDASPQEAKPADPVDGEKPEGEEGKGETDRRNEDEQESSGEESELDDVEPIEEAVEDPEAQAEKQWYILKVQSNREKSICDGLKRRVAVAGLDSYFGDVIVPTEDVAEFKNGKRRVVKRKLYPGYIVVNMAITDETWFLVRETPGIGDFTGSAGRPTPMLPHEVERIVRTSRPEEEGGEPIKTAIPFRQGDRVRIKEGTFENFEGDVEEIDEANGRVTVMINIFGRSTPVELEHWQIDAV